METSQALQGLVFATTDGLSISNLDFAKLLKAHGATQSYIVSKKINYLVSTEDQVRNQSMKVKTALENGVKVVSEQFVLRSIHAGKLVDDSPYILTSASALAPRKDMFSYEKEFVTEIEMDQKKEREKKEQEDLQKLQERLSSATNTTARQPRAKPKGSVTNVRVVAVGTPGQPFFPANYELVYYRTLQWTDVQENHNKYYAIELHIGEEKGKKYFRLYTHYGRTDDLISNPNAGRRECRFYNTEDEAEDAFAAIVLEKTGQKGYRPVDLAFSNIGSDALKALGKGSDTSSSNSNAQVPSTIPQKLQELIRYLYDESTAALSNSLGDVKITAKGIETPLGVVTTTQIEKGEEILRALYNIFQMGLITQEREKVIQLSNAFYTTIPHNIGRSKMSIQNSVIQSMAEFMQKEELLQLMRDMLNVTVETKGSASSDLDMKYAALKNNITYLEPSSTPYKKLHDFVINGQDGAKTIKIENIYGVNRDAEKREFRAALPNHRLLYHGSGVSNFVGLLSRGVLMPKVVVSMGGKRRDVGLLGHGVYFGDSASTAAQYTTQGSKGTRLMLVNNVALGATMQYREYALGLTEPPTGYHSVHGVKNDPSNPSKFEQNEFVIFNTNQQFQAFLVEFKVTTETEASKPILTSELIEPNLSLSTGEIASGPTFNIAPSISVANPSSSNKGSLKRSYNSSLSNDAAAPSAADLLKTASARPPSSYNSGILDNSALKLESTLLGPTSSAKQYGLRSSDSVVESPDISGGVKKDIRFSASAVPTRASAEGTRNRSTSDAAKPLKPITEELGIGTNLAKPYEDVKPTLEVSGDASALGGPKSLRLAIGPYLFEKIRDQALLLELDIALLILKNEEKLRELFVSDRNNFKLVDPYVSLIDVFKNRDEFKHEPESVEDEKIPKLLTKTRLAGLNDFAVVGKNEFQDNFTEFTNGVFKGLDWNNVFVAGGSVLGPLMNLSEEQRSKSFKDSDIDLFLYGLTPEEAAAKVEEIFFIVQSNTNASGEIVRSGHALTIVNTYPIRHVQIVLRLYKSPAEILLGFDIDSCSVGFNGESVFALPRAQRALVKRYNLVDMTRRSLTYESRLYKYSKRGFAVAVPGLFRHLIKPELYQKRPWQVKGLAKLLLFEHAISNPDGRYDSWKPKGLRLRAYKKDEFSEDRINSFEQIDQISASPLKSDYSNLFLPWGPQWFSAQVVKELEHRDKAQWANTSFHVALVGLDSIISGTPRWLKEGYQPPSNPNPLANSLPPKDGRFVFGSLTDAWIGENENPGKQLLTGSFHPVTDDLWYDEAYVPTTSVEDVSQTFCDAAFGNRLNVLRAVLRKNRTEDVNRPDNFYGRLPLHHAALYGAEECARELIEQGADVNALDVQSGFRTMHFAAYSGSSKLIEILHRRGADVTAISSKQKWTPLHIASYYGYVEAVKVLCDISTVDKAAIDIKGRTALFLAAIGGHTEVLRKLIEVGCNLNASSFANETPLIAASKRGNAQVVAVLSQRLNKTLDGLKVMDQPSSSIPKLEEGVLPKGLPLLNSVALDNPVEVEKNLQVNPADVNQSIGQEIDEFRVSALHVAAVRASPTNTINSLVEKTRPTLLNARDAVGQTALHVAVRYLSVEVVNALVKFNSNPNARSFLLASNEKVASFPVEFDAENELGQSPLFYAMSILASFDRDDNFDDTGGLLLALEKKAIDQIRSKLLEVGAARPHLNFFTSLPAMPSSKYYDGFGVSGLVKPELKSTSSGSLAVSLAAYFDEEVKREVERKKDAARFEFNRSIGGMAASRNLSRDPLGASLLLNPNAPGSPMAQSRNIARANEKPVWAKDVDARNSEADEPSHKRVRVAASGGAPPLSSYFTKMDQPTAYDNAPSLASDAYFSSGKLVDASSDSPNIAASETFTAPAVGDYTFVGQTGASSSKSRPSLPHTSTFAPEASGPGFTFASSQGVSPPSAVPTIAEPTGGLNTINSENLNRFNLPTPAPLEHSHRKIPNLEGAVAATFQRKEGQAKTLLGRTLALIVSWTKQQCLSESEKTALKTLALFQSPVPCPNIQSILAAMALYEIQKDDDELLDTFHKLAHLAFA